MRGEIKRLDGRRLLRSMAKIFAAGAVMYAVARGGLWLAGPGGEALKRATILVFVGGAALAAYCGVALLLRAEELGPTATLLRRRPLESRK
jgi:hypothetical protein